MFTFPNQVDNHQNESMIFKMPMIVMTMLMVMTFTMRLYQVYDDKDIYISWKRDSPSTPITKSALRAMLVQSHPASSPDDNYHDEDIDDGDYYDDDYDDYSEDDDK